MLRVGLSLIIKSNKNKPQMSNHKPKLCQRIHKYVFCVHNFKGGKGKVWGKL